MKVQSQTSPLVEEERRLLAKRRLRVVRVALLVAFLGVILRLVYIQIINADHYKDIANSQCQDTLFLVPQRGSIFDRAGTTLASNATCVSFAASPRFIPSDSVKILIADTLGKLLRVPRSVFLRKLRERRGFVWLSRRENPGLRQHITAYHYAGLAIRDEPKRLYHYGALAGQLIGTTNTDNVGISGLEYFLNDSLQGDSGFVVYLKDGKGRAREAVGYPRQEAIPGNNVYLSIDHQIQSIVEDELNKGVERTKADGGVAIVVDPATGDILAMAQNPPVTPGDFSKAEIADQKLRAITDTFEPGSVFKLVTVSAALQDHLVSPNRMFNAENGLYRAPGRKRSQPIRDLHKYTQLSFRDALAHSSNIVMAKVSDIIGKDRMYKTARAFGFGTETHIDLRGEVKGSLKLPTEWSKPTLNTMAYGYEVGVTPLQLAMAYASIANDGQLMKPRLILREERYDGTIVRETRPTKIRNVVSPETAREVRSLLRTVVEEGTGKPAQIAGMTVAGKTGTSRKYIQGVYVKNYTASFIGMVPADQPRLVCLVMLDVPHEEQYTGGDASAPVFREIVRRILGSLPVVVQPPYARVPSDSLDSAIGINSDERGNAVSPSAPGEKKKVPTITVESGYLLLPNLIGQNLRNARKVMNRLQVDARFQGNGVVVRQSPPGGTRVVPGQKVTIVCQLVAGHLPATTRRDREELRVTRGVNQ